MTTRQRQAEIRLPASPRSAAVARDFACRTVAAWRVGVDLEVLVLLVSELATNALLHAGTDFEVTIDLDGGTLRVGVRDSLWNAVPHMRMHSHDALATGRGLMLVESLSRRWGVDRADGSGPRGSAARGGKTVWFELDASA